MTIYDFFEARRWVDDYKNTTGGAKAYVAHQLANCAPALLAAVDEQADKIERRRVRLVEAESDLLNVRGILSPNGYPRRLPDDVDLVPNVAPAVEWLANRVDELTAELAEARAEGRRQAATAVERMPITLGDVGWQHLEAKAVEADYPAGLVRRRRTRDDFTTCTIEAAYQYGYRQAAKVARGEVAPR